MTSTQQDNEVVTVDNVNDSVNDNVGSSSNSNRNKEDDGNNNNKNDLEQQQNENVNENKNDDNDDSVQVIRELIKFDKTFLNNYKTIDLHTITMLNLSNCNLTIQSFPEEGTIFVNHLPNIKILFCSNNYFPILPEFIGYCKNLSMIAFKSCNMTSISKQALQKQLQWLILTDNYVTELPETISNCTNLQKCMLSGNQLSSLPLSMINCQKLELIRLASNKFEVPPIHLLTRIPSLKWIAFSDNPFINTYVTERFGTSLVSSNSESESSESSLQNMQQQKMNLPIIRNITNNGEDGIILGQGAGGITRKVVWNRTSTDGNTEENDDIQYVAVKQYHKNVTVTSDGSPEQEKMINCIIGTTMLSKQQDDDIQSNTKDNTAFIKVLGQTENGGGLVMEFLENYISIGQLPNFNTCSRDVYNTSTITLLNITEYDAIQIVSNLLNCLLILHQLGIHHGDFYGHNILINTSTKNIKLSDYGASFFYDKTTEYGIALQQIECRSFLLFVYELYYNFLLPNEQLEVQQQEQVQTETETTTTTTTTAAATTTSSSSSSSLLMKLVEACTITKQVSTFDEINIIWNQIKLKDISEVFDDYDTTTTTTTSTGSFSNNNPQVVLEYNDSEEMKQ